MKTELESNLQRKMQSIFREYNSYVFKNNGNIFTEIGRPDLVACVPVKLDVLKKLIDDKVLYNDDKIGIFVSIEVKRENQLDEVSEAQTITGEKIKKARGLWYAMDKVDPLIGLLEYMEVPKKDDKSHS